LQNTFLYSSTARIEVVFTVLQVERPMFPTRGCLLGLILLSVFPVCGQTANPDSTQRTTFRANVRRVLVDVVVTNSTDQPVTGLTREQFQVLEDRHQQAIASFEEHAGLPDMSALQAKLPPNTFSNLPLAKSGDAANILLLDALNTQMQDQSFVHAQMIKYIKGIRPGTRLAIFTLGERLRFVQGFTGDLAILMAAMNGQKSAANPQLSPLLQTSAETDADNRLAAQMQELATATGSAQIKAAAAALQQFQQETQSSRTDVRVQTTLEAMQQLARYLQGIPGRKNVIWFSGSFPLTILPDFSMGPADPMRQYEDDVARTANLLSAAQVAIYPIGAQGLAVDRLYDFSGPQPSKSAYAQQMTQYQVGSLQGGSTDRAAAFAAMDELAKDTGGEAFHDTNGLNNALDRVLNHGTHYYTITYSPANKNMDGRLRRIEVKVSGGTYHLAYRRGYYAKDETFVQPAKSNPTGDPLRPLMDHGAPGSTAIVYTMRVLPANPQPVPGAARAGDNENLKGPATRYVVNFTVPADRLTLEPAPDGVRHGSVEVTLLGCDRDGQPLNWMVRVLQLTVRPDRYAAFQASGLSYNLEIDLPAADVYLRSGVYDQRSTRAGTLEIPLAALVALAAAPPAPGPTVPGPPLPGPASAASANVTVPASTVSTVSNELATLALAAAKELETVDVPKYCSGLTGKEVHASSLAAVCEFALDLRKKLSNVICERKTRRYWTTRSASVDDAFYIEHSDVVTVNVSYRDGQEFYSDVRVDGRPVSVNASEPSGIWSHGEFATMLASIFAPASKAPFHYLKETKLHSIPALVLDFKVAAQNNRFYFLESRDKIWFPEYGGKIWVDARTPSLLRLELETTYMQDYPITRTKDEIDYSNLLLGDGTSMVLPTNSHAVICESGNRNCASSMIKFTNWHRFRATTKIVVTPTN
jgi:VWFA-related protein